MSRVSKLRDRYIRETVRKFLAEGFVITVNNGHFDICRRESDYGSICDAMLSAEIDRLTVYRSPVVKADPHPVGWVEISHVNDYRHMFVDYSLGVGYIIAPLDAQVATEVIPDARKRNG